MRAKIDQLDGALDELASAPSRLSDHIDRLKETPAGRRISDVDVKVGRFVSRAAAIVWFIAVLPILGVGYLALTFLDGWAEMALLAVTAAALAWVVWSGMSRFLWPQAASEILVEELEDRVRPASWALRFVRMAFGRRT